MKPGTRPLIGLRIWSLIRRVGTPPADRDQRLVTVGLYVLVCLIWGTTWISIKVAVETVPPLTSAGLRFLAAAPFLLLFTKRRSAAPLRYPKNTAWLFAFITLGYFCLPYFLLNFGEQHISSGLTAIIFASVSVLIVVFSVPVLHAIIRPRQILSVLVAFTALSLLIIHREGGVSYGSRLGVGAVLLAAVMHSFVYVMIKRHGAGINVLTLNTLPITTAGILLTLAGLVFEQPRLSDFRIQAVVALLYLGIIASVAGFLGYFWLLQRLSTVTVSFVFVLFPIIAQVVSVAVEHQPLSALDMALTAIVAAAFGISQTGGRQTAAAAAPAPPPDDLLTAAVLEEVYREAQAQYPNECCGFIRASGVRLCRNVIDELHDEAPQDFHRRAQSGYALSFPDLQFLQQSLTSEDPVRVVFHSHPEVGAYFSAEDERWAVLGGQPVHPVDHLVVDVKSDGVHGAKLFAFDQEVATYVEVAEFGQPVWAGLQPVQEHDSRGADENGTGENSITASARVRGGRRR